MNELDVKPGGGSELGNVIVVRGDDVVPVVAQQHDGGVDHVGAEIEMVGNC